MCCNKKTEKQVENKPAEIDTGIIAHGGSNRTLKISSASCLLQLFGLDGITTTVETDQGVQISVMICQVV